MPLLPVLSTVNSIYHTIATKVASWLSRVPETQINVRTKDVVNNIKNVQLDPKEKLVWFDVTSLYTRVPAMDALRIAANKLYKNDNLIDERPPISKTVFIQIGKLALNNIVMLTNAAITYKKKV